MEAELLEVVISRIDEALGRTHKPMRDNLLKRVLVLIEFERILKDIQYEFNILNTRLRENPVQVNQEDLERIRKVASNVQNITGEYTYFLQEADSLKIHELKDTAKKLRDRIVAVPKIDLQVNNRRIPRALQTEDSGKLTEWLTDSTPGRTIISIWGTTSSSKAIFVKEVCETDKIRNNFECYAWVDVADCHSTGKKDFEIPLFLRKLADHVMEGQRIEDDDLKGRIKDCLNDKRYLVVLNGVDDKEIWLILDSIFPQNSFGCKVVITTHSKEVASLADETRILKRHSFNDLPPDLRNCALFCGLLPRNYWIKRKWVIGLWIAEGFVKSRDYSTRTLEELSEDYFNKLVEYSQIQVLERDVSERIKHFKAPDGLRKIAREQNFGVILDGLSIPDFRWDVPRVFVEKGNEKINFSATMNNIESFISFDKDASPSWNVEGKTLLSWTRHASITFQKPTNCNKLRILCLRSGKLNVVPDDIYKSYNLHYLDLASTKVKKIKSLVKYLKMLNTLDLRGTCVSSLPKEVKMLTNLRHLCVAPSSVPISSDICELTDLQTLKTIKADDKLVLHLRMLKKLRNLFITEVQQCFAGNLWESLSEMPNLCTLGMVVADRDVLNLEEIEPLEKLEKLYLEGSLEERVYQNGKITVPSIFDRFGILKDFRMVMSNLMGDPLRSLSEMKDLLNLHLERAYNGHGLVFCDGWFPHLKKLHLIDMPKLSHMVIKKGTMKNLKYLKLSMLPNLEVPKGMSYLQNLEDLFIVNMEEGFKQTLNGRAARASVQHIKNGITYIPSWAAP